jgi:hypothetical protein
MASTGGTSATLSKTLRSLLAGGLSDFVVEVQGREFKSHRLLLTASSDFFAGMLGGALREATTGRAKLEGCTAAAWQAIHGEMYGTPWAPSTDASVADNALAIIHAGATAAFYQFPLVEDAAATAIQKVASALKPVTVWPVLSAMTAPTTYEHWPWLQAQAVFRDSLVTGLAGMPLAEAAPSVQAIHCIRAPALRALLSADEIDADTEDEVLAVAFTYALLRAVVLQSKGVTLPAAEGGAAGAGAAAGGAGAREAAGSDDRVLKAADDEAAKVSPAEASRLLGVALSGTVTKPADVVARMRGKDLTKAGGGLLSALQRIMHHVGCVRWHLVSEENVTGVAEQFGLLTDKQIVAAYSVRHAPTAPSAKHAVWPIKARDSGSKWTPPTAAVSASASSSSLLLVAVTTAVLGGHASIQGSWNSAANEIAFTCTLTPTAVTASGARTLPFLGKVYRRDYGDDAGDVVSAWPASATAAAASTLKWGWSINVGACTVSAFYESRPGKWVTAYTDCPLRKGSGYSGTDQWGPRPSTSGWTSSTFVLPVTVGGTTSAAFKISALTGVYK